MALHATPKHHVSCGQPETAPGVACVQKRELLQAVLGGDADALCACVAEADPQLDIKLASYAFHQAFLSDVRHNKVGVRMHSGGLASAVFMGLTKVQHGDNDENDDDNENDRENENDRDKPKDDNAITIVCSTAMDYDDPRILDVLIDWEPDFRMAPRTKSGARAECSVQTTIDFFDECRALQCAARLRERKQELVDAERERALRKTAEARIVRVAKHWLPKLEAGRVRLQDPNADLTALRLTFLRDTIRCPQIEVHTLSGYAFTCGLCLLGLPELLAAVDGQEAQYQVEKDLHRLAMRALLDPVHAQANANVASTRIEFHPILDPLVKPFAGLRSKGVPPHVLVHLE